MSATPKLITGKQLSETIYDTIYHARKYLLILSPFIQLDEYFKKEVFERHTANARVHIIIVFGKNEDKVHRSFKREDIEFFKAFPNISIVYIPTLHAKYYGNERQSVVSSMNLIDYSFLNNVELGVHAERSIITGSLFTQSQDLCFNIAEQEGYTIFIKRPQYKKKLIGKDYVGSEIEHDCIEDLLAGKHIEKKPISEFIDEKFIDQSGHLKRKRREEIQTPKSKQKVRLKQDGHCIRCNEAIPLDINYPLCDSCYATWSQFENPDYKETYCVSCGEGKEKISYSRPACRSCYTELAKQGKGRRYSL